VEVEWRRQGRLDTVATFENIIQEIWNGKVLSGGLTRDEAEAVKRQLGGKAWRTILHDNLQRYSLVPG
jgi:hypothetical protein